MSHAALEEHLNEICPNCGTEHKKKWETEFFKHTLYLKLVCEECNYKVFKKSEFMSCGKIDVF